MLNLAAAHFENGVEVIYLFIDDEGEVHLTTHDPDTRVFVAARSVDEVRRFLAEHLRVTA